MKTKKDMVEKAIISTSEGLGLIAMKVGDEIVISHPKMFVDGVKCKDREIAFINNKFVVVNKLTREQI